MRVHKINDFLSVGICLYRFIVQSTHRYQKVRQNYIMVCKLLFGCILLTATALSMHNEMPLIVFLPVGMKAPMQCLCP